MKIAPLYLLFAWPALALDALAGEPATPKVPDAVIEHPAPPGGVGAGTELEPEITITERGDTVIEEYRVGGNLYMIKIVPKKGLPYYLVDSDGDGNMEQRLNDLSPGFLIPSWVLLRW